MLITGSLVLELDLSSWMILTAEEMRQHLMIALTVELVTTTVIMVKMQERCVHSKVCTGIVMHCFTESVNNK